ncbi:MAG: hypothetical protein A2498_12450 [Lentisphaerae bacterium RIFOXYC12_FULL_60_16]|nr:MAG: hypothetical protein A2498_12450 [Lentisphaerae bacterium RIFOXYC12_FULL_60_16]OGV72221.1 MAG: hypothetical protein A2269_06520 [Lentisphaerae bacterium RIFOXYA12_FULL_60_10]OGV83590.1 MAG: hypothetical protein A2340_09510 [Lentisphaerae bacterium RIFOXYB12_FULL_60_10]
MQTLRILTVNIHKGFSLGNRHFVLHRLRDAIRSTHADVVFLQEVVGQNTRKAARHHDWPDQAQHEYLADSVWAHHAYGQNALYPHGHHGNAILSRFPIVHSEQIDTTTNRMEQRGFLYGAVDLPDGGDPLHCLCIHLGLFAASRKKQLRLHADFIDRRIPHDAPMIMAGDFNDWRGDGVDEFARRLNLKDAATEISGRKARTFPAHLPLLPLDRIYIRGLSARQCTTHYRGAWKQLSDHAALLVESERT